VSNEWERRRTGREGEGKGGRRKEIGQGYEERGG
jgi:hypothetical protein